MRASPELTISLPKRFRVQRVLGTGGMGIVYEAIDERRGESVAIKTLRRLSTEGAANLKREFRLVSALYHPNLVPFYDLFVQPESCFFTLELLQGSSISLYVQSAIDFDPTNPSELGQSPPQRSATPPQIARLVNAGYQICAALSYLHQNGVIHKDLKPSNIIVSPSGALKLLDFGISQSVLATESTGIVGTPHYMSPEQARGERVGPPSDMYSFGVLLYFLITQRYPFEGKTIPQILAGHKRLTPTPPDQFYAGLPAELGALCMALLEKSPEARPTPEQAMTRLHELGAPPPPRRSTARRRFVGRQEELDQIASAAAEVRDRGPRGVLLWGESGTGKSALCQEAVRWLREAHWRVIFGRCYDPEALPYSALEPLAEALVAAFSKRPPAPHPQLPLLASLFPALRVLPGAFPAPLEVSAPERRRRAAEGLRWLLREYAKDRPLVLWIDDLQLADKDSLDLLAGLFEEDGPALLLLGTFRTSAIQRPYPLERLHGQPGLRSRYLSPLRPNELLSLCPGPVAPELLAEILRESRGNVSLAALLLEAVSERQTQAGAVAALLRERVESLPPRGRLVINALGLARSALSFDELCAVTSLRPPALSKALDALRWEHWISLTDEANDQRYSLYHERMRDVIVDALSQAEREALHERIGDALLASQRQVQAALHFLASPRPERARLLLLDAAHAAAEQRAYIQAVDLYELVFTLPGEDDSIHIEAYALALERAGGRSQDSSQVYQQAARRASGLEATRLSLLAADQQLRGGNFEDALAAYQRILSPYGETLFDLPRGPLACVAELALRLPRLERRLTQPSAPPVPETPSEALRRITRRRVGFSLGCFHLYQGAVAAVRMVDAALSAGTSEALADALLLGSMFLSLRKTPDALSRAQNLLARARALPQQEPEHQLLSELCLGVLYAQQGQFSHAQRVLEAAHSGFYAAGFHNTPELGITLATWLYSATSAGTPHAALRAANDLLESAITDGDQVLLGIVVPLFAWTLLMRGDYTRAQEMFSLLPLHRPALSNFSGVERIGRAVLLLAAREASAARALLTRFLSEPIASASLLSPTQASYARVLLALCCLHDLRRAQDPRARRRALQEGLALARAVYAGQEPTHRGIGWRLEGLLHRENGALAPARAALDQAVHLLSQRGEAPELAAALLARYSLSRDPADKARALDIIRSAGFVDPAQREGGCWSWEDGAPSPEAPGAREDRGAHSS